MNHLFLVSIAVLFLATGTAHAVRALDYRCGKTNITISAAKGPSGVIGTSIEIVRPDNARSSGQVIFGKDNSSIYYVLGGKRYKCKGPLNTEPVQ
jgi:hypothetical protein